MNLEKLKAVRTEVSESQKLICFCQEHCVEMCNVGGFLWEADSLWETHVGGTGLGRPDLFF